MAFGLLQFLNSTLDLLNVLLFFFRSWTIPYSNIATLERVDPEDCGAGIGAIKFTLNFSHRIRVVRLSGLDMLISPENSEQFIQELRAHKAKHTAH